MPLNLHRQTRELFHDTCLLCGGKNPVGLKLDFEAAENGSVSARFMCQFRFEGYKGFLHGGVTAALIDSAMTNCLFAKGIAALTAELNLKYKKPVRCGKTAEIKAWLEKAYPPLYTLKAELSQDGAVVAAAEAKFMENDDLCRKTG